ncbi:MAG: glycosyltransferase family 4 protein [Bacteroidales bacterium]|nr:glycosyltransferase family 4 protein [Bacteroidales bacterium]MCF8391179.1 glycosyltransferase family 4 protein [Bacteroidales bacterium]
MKIAVNTRLLIPDKLDGIGWFSFETLKRITKSHPEHEFYFLFDRKYSSEFIFAENVHPVIVRPVTRHPVLWYLWLEYSIPKVLRKLKADIFVSPDGFISLSSKIPSVSVIHDINFFHRPKDLPFFSRKYYNYFFPRFAKISTKIGTVSEYSANDIADSYSVKKNKIDVLYNGVNEIYKPVKSDLIHETRLKYSSANPYFVFVGTLHPRKNIVNMLKAFDLFRRETESDIKMLIVGERMFLTGEIDDALSSMEYSKDVIFTGRLSPEDLHLVIASALAMTFVPYFEGFGIPLLEAMKCGVPVIASDRTSLPEVGGDAAIYCDPDNTRQISVAMLDISANEKLRTGLIEKGLKRASDFSWDKSAERFWSLIEKVLHGA